MPKFGRDVALFIPYGHEYPNPDKPEKNKNLNHEVHDPLTGASGARRRAKY
jgi:hypothetical protein